MMSLLVMLAFGQSVPVGPTNVDFSVGEIGKMPPGWIVSEMVKHAGYRVELQREDCARPASSCIVYVPPVRLKDIRTAEIIQRFPATAYIGKQVKFSAELRMDGPGNGEVEIKMRVDHSDGRTEFFQALEGPVRGFQWQQREVVAKIEPDAVSIAIWARFQPAGMAWVSGPSFGVVQ